MAVQQHKLPLSYPFQTPHKHLIHSFQVLVYVIRVLVVLSIGPRFGEVDSRAGAAGERYSIGCFIGCLGQQRWQW